MSQRFQALAPCVVFSRFWYSQTEVFPPAMAYSSRPYARRYASSNRFPIGLKWLLIANVGIFVLTFFLARAGIGGDFFRNFFLVPSSVVTTFAVWQVVTYMFFHAGFSHILWNMLTLWMFGAELERTWGTSRFLRFYFACGIGAAVTVILVNYLFGDPNAATVGSSGAIYGILMAYAVLFPDRMILFGFLIPIKVKYFVMIMGAVIFMNSFVSFGSGISQAAHLGGLVVGFFLLRGRWLMTRIQGPVKREVTNWKLRRARKKFEVYLRKQDSKPDRWTH
jgi:membrane associated rhomboid family serine protease